MWTADGFLNDRSLAVISFSASPNSITLCFPRSSEGEYRSRELVGEGLCGANHPAVYTNAIATMSTTPPITATDFSGKSVVVLSESAMQTSSMLR
jgi:hypothetical protein